MKTILAVVLIIIFPQVAFSQNDTISKVAFQGMDFTWLNGNNRQASNLLTSKYITGLMIMDTYWNYSFNNPRDNTINTSSTIGRHNEITLNMASIGAEVLYKNVIARIYLQSGAMLSIIQETDPTVNHGRNLRTTDLKNIREAVVGYQWNKAYGLRFESGIFMSFIGLESYVSQENWSYQRSMVCDFTPFYFTGARLQYYPTKFLKIEPWLMNGWYSYGKFNQATSLGMSINYRPKDYFAFVANFYYGADTRNTPGRKRAHHDNSVLLRYANNPASKGISKAAFSLNSHYGFEEGGYGSAGEKLPTMSQTYFVGTSFANRIWFNENHFAVTLRAGWLSNPGRYLAVSPSPVGYIDNPTNNPAAPFKAWELAATLDYMPNDYITFRMEFLNRHSNVPYFAGRGGTTSPDGWQGTPGTFVPDLVKLENRIILAMNCRF